MTKAIKDMTVVELFKSCSETKCEKCPIGLDLWSCPVPELGSTIKDVLNKKMKIIQEPLQKRKGSVIRGNLS